MSSSSDELASFGNTSTVSRIILEDKLKAFGVGDTERILSVAFHPVKQYIAFGCENSCIKLWNIRSKLYGGIFTHHGSVNALQFSSDGNVLASAASGHAEGNTIALWQCVHDIKNEDELNLRLFMHDTELSPFRAEVLHQGIINSLAFGPTMGKFGSTTLASASDDATVRIWQYPPKYKMSRQTLRSHQTKVTSCAFSEDGRYLISASIDGVICVHRIDFEDEAPDESAAAGLGSTDASGAKGDAASGGNVNSEGDDQSTGDGSEGSTGDDKAGSSKKTSDGDAAKGGAGDKKSGNAAKGAPPPSVEEIEQKKKDEEETEVVPDITFTHVYRFSCMEPILDIKFFPDFDFITQIGTSVKTSGPDRQYLLCAGGAKSLILLRLRDGYLSQEPWGNAPQALEELSNIERLTTVYAGDREVSYAMRKLNYSQVSLQQRIPMPEPVRSITCQRFNVTNNDAIDVDPSLRTHSGYLDMKRATKSILLSTWKSRYFVPNMDQGEISWFKDEELGDLPKGFLRFDTIRSVMPMSRKRDPEGRQFRVYLYGTREPMILRAESRESRRKWIRVFDAGMNSIKPNVYIINASSGNSVYAFVIQSLFSPTARPTTSQAIAEVRIRNLNTFKFEEIGEHDDYITAIAVPDPDMRQKMMDSHILEKSEYMCISTSADQTVRAFVWELISPRDKKKNADDEQAPENPEGEDEEATSRIDFNILTNYGKPWIKLERPLTQLQLNSVVEEATELATTAMMKVEVATTKPVTLGFPSKPDVNRLGLVKIEGIDLDSDDEEFFDGSDDEDPYGANGDETAIMKSIGTELLGPAAPVEGSDVLVAAQVLQGPKRLTAAESVIQKAELRKELEESNMSPEEFEREKQRISDHQSLGQLRSYARMLARQEYERTQLEEGAEREMCNTDGCTIA